MTAFCNGDTCPNFRYGCLLQRPKEPREEKPPWTTKAANPAI